MKHYFVYILACDNGSFYTGYTDNLERRYHAHCQGKCKYTRSFKPLGIAQSWTIVGSRADAMKVERYIKGLPASQKRSLIALPEQLRAEFDTVLIPVRELT